MLSVCRVNMLILAAILVLLFTKTETIDTTESTPAQNNSFWPSDLNNSHSNESNQVRNDSNKTQYGIDFIKKETRNSEVFVAGRSDGYRTTFTTYETKGFVAESGFGNNSGTDRATNYEETKPNPPDYIPTKAIGGIPVPLCNLLPPNNEIAFNQTGCTIPQYGDPSSQIQPHVQSAAIGGMPVPLVNDPDSASDPFLNEKLVSDSGHSIRFGLNGPVADEYDDKIKEYEEKEQETWQVSVFSKEVVPFVRVCGGSLVTSTAVISAAQCYWGVGPLPAAQFGVVARDALNNGSPSTDDYSSYLLQSDVRAIHIPPSYRGALSNFQDDIAVLLVEPFLLHEYLKPVCVNFDRDLEERQLTAGSLGTTLASSIKLYNQPTILRNIKVPLVDVEECKELTPVQNLKYITSDKICAGVTIKPPNASLCLQPAGSGLAFPAGAARAAMPFLRGVASTPLLSVSCPAYDVRAYTLLRAHRSFLLQHIPALKGECAQIYPQLHAPLTMAPTTQDDGGDGGREGEGESDEEDNAQFVCNCYC